MLTENQKQIIREVCSIEFKSLEAIFGEVELGLIAPNLTFEEYLGEYELTRADFDENLVDVYHKFKAIEKDPTKVFFILNPAERKVFRIILLLYEENWISHLFSDFLGIWHIDFNPNTHNFNLQLN